MEQRSHLPLVLAICAGLFSTPTLKANTWAVGAAVDAGSGVSVLYNQSNAMSYHVSAHTKTSEEVSANVDLQRYFLKTSFGIGTFPVWLKCYGGIGVRSFADKNTSQGENIYLRLPLGLEVAPWHIPLDIFVDGAVNLGPAPRTTAYLTPRAGIRATF